MLLFCVTLLFWRWGQHVHPKRQLITTRTHGFMSQNTILVAVRSLRPWNLKYSTRSCRHEYGGNTFLRNVGKLLLDYTSSRPMKINLQSQLRELQTSQRGQNFGPTCITFTWKGKKTKTYNCFPMSRLCFVTEGRTMKCGYNRLGLRCTLLLACNTHPFSPKRNTVHSYVIKVFKP
jgi:hypothetical protein